MSFYTDFPKYPTAIFSDTDYPNQTDDVNIVYAALVNALKEELQACFAELGTVPKGTHVSVKTRLNYNQNHLVQNFILKKRLIFYCLIYSC